MSRVSITVSNGNSLFTYDLTDDFPCENLVALCIGELGQPDHKPQNVVLVKDGKNALPKDLSKPLKESNVSNGDVLLYHCVSAGGPSRPSPTAAPPPTSNPTASGRIYRPASDLAESIASVADDMKSKMAALISAIKIPQKVDVSEKKARELFDQMNEPNVKMYCYSEMRELFDTYQANPNDFVAFRAAYQKWEAEEKRKLKEINDPFSEEGQLLIQKIIYRDNVNKSYKRALDLMPEAFIPVHMLYIRLKVNGKETIGFIDSGAQVSIMSLRFAKDCHVDHMMDDRFRGHASGVGGVSKFAGRIHTCQLEINDHYFMCKFDVLQDRDMDLLIGLDVLRRHQCSIDLKSNKLLFGDGTSTEFLSDAEIAEHKGNQPDMTESIVVDDAKLSKVVGLGFAKEFAHRALQISFNDVDGAIQYLIEQESKEKKEAMETGEHPSSSKQ